MTDSTCAFLFFLHLGLSQKIALEPVKLFADLPNMSFFSICICSLLGRPLKSLLADLIILGPLSKPLLDEDISITILLRFALHKLGLRLITINLTLYHDS